MKMINMVIVLSIFFMFASPVRADSTTVSDISQELICQCGCNMVLLNCSHAECASRGAMVAYIEQKLDEGQSGEQIIQLFVAQYGEQVLASPPKRGFNLTAWILPFAALLLGGVTIYMLLKKWVRRGERPQAVIGAENDDGKYQHQLEQELGEFTDRGFR